jgi:hypothetical protein
VVLSDKHSPSPSGVPKQKESNQMAKPMNDDSTQPPKFLSKLTSKFTVYRLTSPELEFIRGPAKEAMRTLGLLIPYGSDYSRSWWRLDDDRDHRGWFKDNTDSTVDPRAAEQAVESWRVRDFVYWRQRLVSLETEYNTAAPRGILQWWRDKRARGGWRMLWLAILGALLAVLSLVASTVTGGISAREGVVANQKEGAGQFH